jgi:serine/threonine-protein kinase ATR
MNKERAAVGRALVREAAAALDKKRKFQSSTMLNESTLLFHSLVELAQNQPKDRRIRWAIGTECQLTYFLVPSQSALTLVFPSTEELSRESSHNAYFPSNEVNFSPLNRCHRFISFVSFFLPQEYFQSFDCSVEVLMTKAKPKKISAVTTSGRSIRFLLKQEKHGDLRKDARLMEFNTVVNRLLQEESESRKRNLRLRTFCVVCLNEECGIMEWVPNTTGLRSLVVETHSRCLSEYPYLDLRKIKDVIEEMQLKFVESNLEELLSEYRRLVLHDYRPCFHKWFLARFTDPTEWLEARDRFTRSSAVW